MAATMSDAKLFVKILSYVGIPFTLVLWVLLNAAHERNRTGDIRIGFVPIATSGLVSCAILWLALRGDIDRKGLAKDAFKLIGLLLGGAFLLMLFMMGPWMPDSTRYSAMYNTSKEHVHIERRPTDFDWWQAPIGGKGCYYEKHIEVLAPENGGLSLYTSVGRRCMSKPLTAPRKDAPYVLRTQGQIPVCRGSTYARA
jgi:hypothetical protein